MTDDFVSMTKKLNCAEVNDQTTTQTTTFTSENMSFHTAIRFHLR